MDWKSALLHYLLVLTMFTLLGYANPPRYTALDLGTLGGNSTPRGLNDFGQVVGDSYISADVQHAFLFSGGNMIDLGTLGGNGSQAFGINNRGQVVVSSDTAGGQMNAFFFSDGAMTDLGFDGGAAAIRPPVAPAMPTALRSIIATDLELRRVRLMGYPSSSRL